MINNDFEKLKIEYLKMSLSGKPIEINYEQKGYDVFEKSFRYYISQSENGGNCIDNLDNNNILFNFTKESRSFEAHIVGFVDIKKNNSNFDLNVLENNYYEPKIINLKFENVDIKYDILNMQFIKGQQIISFDITGQLKTIAREDSSNKSYSGLNIFQKAEKVINNDKRDIVKEKFQNKISKEEILNYIQKLLFFSEYLKENFNKAQKKFPNIIKFVKINLNNNHEKETFMFHVTFTRELDAAFKVIKDYDFQKYSGLEEKNINEDEEKIIFKKNDILLFELNDSTIEYLSAKCIYNNYNVLNGHIELLKQKKEFKDCQFFYIGIQEKKPLGFRNIENNIYEQIRSKESLGHLKIKLFEFVNEKIFNKEFRKENPDKMKILDLLKDERQKIENKINSRLDKIERMIYFLLAIVAIIFAILIAKNK